MNTVEDPFAPKNVENRAKKVVAKNRGATRAKKGSKKGSSTGSYTSVFYFFIVYPWWNFLKTEYRFDGFSVKFSSKSFEAVFRSALEVDLLPSSVSSKSIRGAVFEISAIWLRAGRIRLGPKIPPGRADFGRKFSRAGPIPKKLVWRKTTSKLV